MPQRHHPLRRRHQGLARSGAVPAAALQAAKEAVDGLEPEEAEVESVLAACLAFANKKQEAVALAVRTAEIAVKTLDRNNPKLEYYTRILKSVQEDTPIDLGKLRIIRS